MGELRGGYIAGDLSPEERAQAKRQLWDHLAAGGPAKDEPTDGAKTEEPPAEKPGRD